MLNVLLMDSDADNALLETCLCQQGFNCLRIQYGAAFLTLVKDIKPDVVIFNLHTPSENLLGDLRSLNQQLPLPVIIFSKDAHIDTINQAIQSEISAYIVDGFACHRLASIIHVALARFRQQQALKNALEESRAQLEDRKLIDRAKAILIKTQNFTENEAYHTLRKLAMDRNITLGEMAKNVIAMAALLK
ncbi:MAG: ANTAR domain-containing protein [Methylovulum miyakonense]|uniref:ANTAR domain-containing response regulator n=1 Tax=Methylovulum miyakonense TaxID=645578 RepID=UPI003BB4D651